MSHLVRVRRPAVGFVPLPPGLMAAILAISGLYVLAAELLKPRFYRGMADARY
jgi:hypothetical protein